MADVLILGGTRDIGYFAALALLAAGLRVSILNRGRTRDELPAEIERLRADRSTPRELRSALGSRRFDLVLDTTTYDERDARQAVEAFSARVARYVFISSGQVYLVREGARRPFVEEDYDGPLIREPEPGTAAHASWLYGVEKRAAEDVFREAWNSARFPVTLLRLPMVASQRDPRGRVQAYIARLLDGGPVLIPPDPEFPLRHVYVADVARLVASLAGRAEGLGGAYNVSWGESMTLADFIALLGQLVDREPRVERIDRALLESRALLPDCSPFSSRWMSELDNNRGLAAFSAAGLQYTPPAIYLKAIADDYVGRWQANSLLPSGYSQRDRELSLVRELRRR